MTNTIHDLGGYENPVVAIPRLGKIHLGEPKKNGKSQGAAGYFVLPGKLKQYFSDKPTILPILLPSNEREEFFSQKWRRYVTGEQLVCYGDGIEAKEISRDFKEWNTHECRGFNCPHVSGEKKNCSRKGFFWFYLRIPGVPLSGIWQIDTVGANSMRRINAQVDAYATQLPISEIAMVPMLLSLHPETTKDAENKTKKIHVLNLSLDLTPEELAERQRVSFRKPSMVEQEQPKEENPSPQEAPADSNPSTTKHNWDENPSDTRTPADDDLPDGGPLPGEEETVGELNKQQLKDKAWKLIHSKKIVSSAYSKICYEITKDENKTTPNYLNKKELEGLVAKLEAEKCE